MPSHPGSSHASHKSRKPAQEQTDAAQRDKRKQAQSTDSNQ